MRIAIMCAAPGGAGLCPYPVDLAIAFRALGHEVHAIRGSDREYETGLAAKLEAAQLPVRNVPFSEVGGRAAFSPFDSSLRRALDELKPDVVHSWGPRFAYQGRSFAFSKHRPIHVAMIMSMGHDAGRKWPERVGALLANRYLDSVLANCELEARRLKAVGVKPSKVQVMLAPMACPPNLELAAAARAEGREAVLREAGLPADRKYVGCFAQFRPVKRQDLLIQAFGDVAGEFPEWDLVLAGQGDKLEECKSLAAALPPGRVRFLGSIPHERAVRLTAVVDAVAHSSTVETFGYSILEALLLGKPLLTTRVGVAVEVEQAGKAIVVEPGSREALAKGLRTLLRGGPQVAAMTEGTPEWITENFDTPRVAARLVALYEQMLAARSRG